MFRPPTKYSEYLQDVRKSIDYILKRVNATTVNKIVAGTNVTISPADGTGIVTINASGGGGGGLPAGGTTGQILAKINNVDYNAEWIDNFALWTSTVQHEVKASEPINKGQAVYVSGADGTNMIVSKASNTSEATSSKTMGLLAQTLATNGKGFVITEGLLAGLNTSGATAGDPVWLGASGNLIYGLINKPYAPLNLVFIGIVTRVNANNGEIFVKVQNGFELDELHNVDARNPNNNDGIFYNSTTQLWEHKPVSAVYATPTLAQVTTAGNTTTNAITVGATQYKYLGGVVGEIRGNANTYNNFDLVYGASWDGSQWIDELGAYGSNKLTLGNDGIVFYTGSNQASGFPVNYTERMRMASTGNVLIGTTTDAGYKLDVNGSVNIGSSSFPFASNLVTLTSSAGTSALRVGGGNTLYVSGPLTAANLAATDYVWVVRVLVGNGLARLTATTTDWLSITDSGQTANGSGNLSAKFATFGTTYATINASAQVEIASTTRGFLQPRMTNAQAVAITTPATGLQVYDTTNNKNLLYNGTAWQNIATETWVSGQGYLTSTPTLDQVVTAGNSVSNNGITITKTSGATLTLNPGPSDNAIVINNSGFIRFTGAGIDSFIRGNSTVFSVLGAGYVSKVQFHWGGSASYINTGGNFLIGTTTDAGYKLDVNGTIRSSGTNGLVLYDGTYGAKVSMSSYFFTIEREGTYGVSTYQFKYSDNSDALYLTGFTSIRGLGGGDDAVMMSRNVYARHDAAFGFTTYGSTTKYKAIQAIYTDNNTSGVAFNYKTAGTDTEAMRITSAGQVGIGTTTPTYKLQVIGNTYNTFSTTAPFLVDTSANNYRIGNLINNSGYHTGGFANNTFDIFSVGANSSSSANASQFFRININGGSSSGAYGSSGNNVTLAQLNAVTNSILYITAQGQGGYIQGSTSSGLTVSTLTFGENLSLRSDMGSGFGGGGINYYASINGANHSHRWFTTLTEHMRLTSGGNLLIGTTTDAGYKLDVNGSAKFGDNFVWDNTNSLLTLTNPAVSPSTLRLNSKFSNLTKFQFTQEFVAGTYTEVGYIGYLWGTGMTLQSYQDLIFNPGNTEKVRITSTGNVGIGTTTPTAKLQIKGTGDSSVWVTTDDFNTGSNTGSVVRIGTRSSTGNTQGWIDVLNSGVSSYGNLILTGFGGNVLIGTSTDAGYKLDVNGIARVGDTNSYGDVFVVRTPGIGWSFDYQYLKIGVVIKLGADRLQLRVNNNTAYVYNNGDSGNSSLTIMGGHDGATTQFAPIIFGSGRDASLVRETMRVDNQNQRVGIGTTSPIYNLEVSSTGYTGLGLISGANNTAEISFQNRGYGLPRWTIRATSAPDGSSGELTFQRLASSFDLTIKSTGNVLIGTTTDAGYKLDVNGSTRIKGTGTTDSTIALLVQNNTGRLLLQSDDGGFTRIGGPTARLYVGVESGGAAARLVVNGEGLFSNGGIGNAGGFYIDQGGTSSASRTIWYDGSGTPKNLITGNGDNYITSGNFGLGTTTPTDKLHIVDNTNGNKFGRISAGGTDASAAWVAQNDQVDNVVYRVFGSAVTGSQMGISLARSASLMANLGGSGKFLVGTYSSTDFVMGTGNQERMRLVDSTGNFLIGTTTDNGNKLQVSGNIDAQGYKVNNVLGYTGILNIPTNPPGQQNIDIQGGIVINIF